MKGKILPVEFFTYDLTPKEPGLKFVIFRIEDRETGKMIGFDFGFAEFKDGKFEEMGDEQRRAWVVRWAEQPDPHIVL